MDVTDCVSSSSSMEYYENRLRTFDTYPKQLLPDKFQLARAGLYYTGKIRYLSVLSMSCEIELMGKR